MLRWALSFFLALTLLPFSGATAASESEAAPIKQKFSVDEMADACSRLHDTNKDKICEVFIQVQQVGRDAVELAKETLKLTPAEYAFLTVANSIASGRIRFQTDAFVISDASLIWDMQRDQTQVLLEKRF